MPQRFFNNADSFAMAFDDEWNDLNIKDKSKKIKKILEILSDHPYVISNPKRAEEIANFRIRFLKKL